MTDEPHWVDKAAADIERLLGDPLADAVLGFVRVVAVSEPAPRGRYQEAQVTVVPEDHPDTAVALSVVIDRRFWPSAGMRLPARIPPAAPTALEVDWEALRPGR